MYPRRYCLGLIEALQSGRRWRVRDWYPRRYCLGLIEAISAIAEPPIVRRGYPRRYCLGLIEAVVY